MFSLLNFSMRFLWGVFTTRGKWEKPRGISRLRVKVWVSTIACRCWSKFSSLIFARNSAFVFLGPGFDFFLSQNFRGPALKKRPMIIGQEIKSADFYLPSRGYQILLRNEFLFFQFRFKPKISSRKLFPSDSSKIRPKISPRKKRFRNLTPSQRKIIKKNTHSVEEKGLLMQ